MKRSAQIPYSIALNQYGSASQNVALSALDSFITGLPGANSIGFWVKGSDLATVPAYIFGGSVAAGSTFCLIGVNRLSTTLGRINWQMRDSDGDQLGIESTAFVLNNRWHHVVFTKTSANTAATMKIYIDGVQSGQTTIFSQTFSNPVALGRTAYLGSGGTGGSFFFKGLLTQFGLWQRELTSDEVSRWYKGNVVPSSPHRFYSCEDDAMTTTLTDSSGNADNGTLDSVNMWSENTPSF